MALPEEKRKTYKVPLTQETFDNLFSGEALSTIVEKLAETNRPNQKSSDFTSEV